MPWVEGGNLRIWGDHGRECVPQHTCVLVSLFPIAVVKYPRPNALLSKGVNLDLSVQFWGSKACYLHQLGSGEDFVVDDISVAEPGAGETDKQKAKPKPHGKAGNQRVSHVRLTSS